MPVAKTVAPKPETQKATLGAPAADARVDRLAELMAWDDANKKDPRTKELAELKKTFVTEINAKNKPDVEVTVRGAKMAVTFSSCVKGTQITSMKQAHKLLGDETFYQIASISVGDLKDYLTPEQRAKISKEDHTETRKVVGKPAKVA